MPTNIKTINNKNGLILNKIDWSNSPNNISTIYELDENVPIDLKIKVSDGDKVYLDGLDSIDYYSNCSFTDIDENQELYINNNADIFFYTNLDESISYIPGYYMIRLVHNDKNYYSYLHIIPKYLSDDEYNNMILDLENIAEGLSQDNYRYFHGISNMRSISNSNRQLDILRKYFKDFQNVIFSLNNEPRSEISSVYKWSNNITSSLDYRSTIKMSSNPRKNKVYCKHHILNINTIDNIILKNNINKINIIINSLYDMFHSKLLKDYSILIDNFLLRSWIKDVDSKMNIQNNIGSNLMNHNYNFIKELVNSLENVNILKNSANRDFSYIQKSSQRLYEIWGFVRVVNTFIKMGFRPKSENSLNDIIGENILDNIQKGLKHSKTVEIEKNIHNDLNLKVNVIYNSTISNDPKSKHIYTNSNHNRPDIRMDFFDTKGTFIGSSIIDTKYRKKMNILDKSSKGSISQLKDYSDSIRSNDEFLSNDYDTHILKILKNNKASVVKNVGVMYPGADKFHRQESNIKSNIDADITTIIDYPGNEKDDLSEFLQKNIDDIISNAKDLLIINE